MDVRGPDECWPWTGHRLPAGYGRFGSGYSHREAYEVARGEIPTGSRVRHSCDNPPCCNPAHLLCGTAKQNSSDTVERRRHRYGEAHRASKLKLEDVLEIANRRIAGEAVSRLAAEYGLSVGHTYDLARGNYWNVARKESSPFA